MVKLKMYNKNSWSLVRMEDKNFFISGKKKKRRMKAEWEKNLKLVSPEEVERISLSRTKNNIRNICLSNDFEYFATLTINSKNCDRFSLQQCQDKCKKLFHKLKRKYNDFAYIYITEEHKNGGFHFHGMIKGIPKSEFVKYSSFDNIPEKLKKIIDNSSEDYYHLPFFDEELGYNTFSTIREYNKCCSYITKYITKKCVKNENNQIYFCSSWFI